MGFGHVVINRIGHSPRSEAATFARGSWFVVWVGGWWAALGRAGVASGWREARSNRRHDDHHSPLRATHKSQKPKGTSCLLSPVSCVLCYVR
jgi:hypothetical protein